MATPTGDKRDPRHLPPGGERCELLLALGEPVTLSDFDDDERAELIADLHQIKAQVRYRGAG